MKPVPKVVFQTATLVVHIVGVPADVRLNLSPPPFSTSYSVPSTPCRYKGCSLLVASEGCIDTRLHAIPTLLALTCRGGNSEIHCKRRAPYRYLLVWVHAGAGYSLESRERGAAACMWKRGEPSRGALYLYVSMEYSVPGILMCFVVGTWYLPSCECSQCPWCKASLVGTYPHWLSPLDGSRSPFAGWCCLSPSVSRPGRPAPTGATLAVFGTWSTDKPHGALHLGPGEQPTAYS